ncbi:MAG: formylglycine-generating enzyme family protein [Phycisphaerales bacterium]
MTTGEVAASTNQRPPPAHADTVTVQPSPATPSNRAIEIAIVVLLALATFCSTWCGYQARRWSAAQAAAGAGADAAERQAAENIIVGLQLRTQDGLLLLECWRAMREGQTEVGDMIVAHMRPQLQRAVKASIDGGVLINADATGPLQRPEYVLAPEEEAARLRAIAQQLRAQASASRDVADEYVLLTLLCASVLFFGGIASTLSARRVRVTTTLLAAVLFAGTTVLMFRLPLYRAPAAPPPAPAPPTTTAVRLTAAQAGGPSAQGACCASEPAPVRRRPPVAPPSPDASAVDARQGSGAPPGMVWIPGGEFQMGSTGPLARSDESPVHAVRVDGFWMDATEVTNAQFAAFIAATGYTTTAQRPVDWEQLRRQLPSGTPRPAPAMLAPGSLVFTPPAEPVDTSLFGEWWKWTAGADWRHPQGAGSSIEGKEACPVVQVSFEDCTAYCAWAGKSLPTEAQWEFAARGGLAGADNVWGDEPVSPARCNSWQGRFPDRNTAEDGFVRAAPVRSFPPNGYGLYDMAGNVWEWCADLYRPDAYRQSTAPGSPATAINPAGPARSWDPRNPHSPESRVQRGGSFLCQDSYCAGYRPSARMAAPPDTAMEHLGFRCVMAPGATQPTGPGHANGP